MLSRLMDLVVLVAELTKENDKSYKDLDQELTTRGYSLDEIERAVFWYSSRGEIPEEEKIELHNRYSVRVLSEWERLSLCSECYGYLLRLFNLGIVDGEQFEKIIARAIPVGPEKIQLNDVKAIACSVIFNRDPGDLEDEFVDFFDEDLPTS
jgi:uncharacterized protein Smg (DUF494 family)